MPATPASEAVLTTTPRSTSHVPTRLIETTSAKEPRGIGPLRPRARGAGRMPFFTAVRTHAKVSALPQTEEDSR